MSEKQKYSVLFCGPIAKAGEPARGGYQACNKRTIDFLKRAGIIIHPLPYPEPQEKGVKKYILYLMGFLILFYKILTRSKPGCIFHLTGLYKYFIPIELIILLIARFGGCNTIYDVRAGSAIRYFESGSKWYKFVFVFVLKQADLILVEGERYINFIHKISGKIPRYFPNHIETSKLQTIICRRNNSGNLRLIYVGKISAEKGISVIPEISCVLNELGLKNEVVIVGNGDTQYIESVKQRYKNCKIKFTGPLESGAVICELSNSHFFVFPTVHLGEGHSNALTEAMAVGCVPVVSENGFNRSVVGECGRVVANNLDANLYANAIAMIWESTQWGILSEKCKFRVNRFFDTDKVVKDLIDNYNSMGLIKN